MRIGMDGWLPGYLADGRRESEKAKSHSGLYALLHISIHVGIVRSAVNIPVIINHLTHGERLTFKAKSQNNFH